MFFRIVPIAVAFVWCGMLAAISFMETPLKFHAPNITLPLGLGIGRIVFQTLNKIEITLAILMIIAMFAKRPQGRFAIYSFLVIIVLLGAETLWLLPLLDARAELIIRGDQVAPSVTHFIYIACDAAKLILLFALGINLTKQNMRIE